MKANNLPAVEIRRNFIYSEDDGQLLWAQDRNNVCKAYSVAGSINKDGYKQVMFNGKRYLIHRLVWSLFSNSDNPEEIDHINGNRLDNRIENLRACSRKHNLQNQRFPSKHNSVGVLGVSFCKDKKKYRAQIAVDGKDIRLGYFEDINSAKNAYLIAKRKYHIFCTI